MNFRRVYLSALCSTFTVTATSFVATASADDTRDNSGFVMEEVTVTAQRRDERALDVPIAITALGSEQLGKGDVQQLGDIMKLTPGLRFDSQGGNAQPTIRGVGSSVVMAGAGSNIAVYTDGFYSPNPLVADSELLNIESVQVLKGPQGTLFGRNSTGGAILVTTRDPSHEAEANLEASIGSYNAQRYAGYVTTGITDSLAMDFSAVHRSGDGYLENIITSRDDVGEYENWAARLGILWDVTDKTSVLFRYTQTDSDDPSQTSINFLEINGVPQSYAATTFGATISSDPRELANSYPFGYTSESKAYQLRVRSDLGFATLTSYSQYRDELGIHDYDFDASAVDIYHYHFETEDTIFTQEFLLSSNSDGPLQWTVGLFYLDNDTIYPNNQAASIAVQPFEFNVLGGTGINASSIAVFTDITYALTEALYLTVGARYSKDELTDAYFYEDIPVRTKVAAPDVEDSKLTPRIALRYSLSENSSVYVSYSEGFKSSLLNLAGGTLDDIDVRPEEIQAYEVGYKFSGDRSTLDVAAFYYDYTDLQAISYAGADTIVNNAASSSVQGIEFQGRLAVTKQLEVNLGIAYLNAEYDDYQDSQTWTQCLAAECGGAFGLFLPAYVDGSGNEMMRSPELTATLGASYLTTIADGSLALSGNLYYTSDFYFDTSEVYEQESYQLLSLRAEWTAPSEHYSFALYGDNLTDEDYVNSLLPQYYGALSTWGAPRTLGVSGRYYF
ncbi:TonB-dependent receptor [Halioxenophilus sp. WMMB6]|uniref:TonB-dependent receptor n=1 Tax=Halioxenophilus sp. WMMB6 TaxID=3073815 RepID=UPI00295F047F|nr:TonB-dependent receptor [Halioxenophilus sp. WMMB6]